MSEGSLHAPIRHPIAWQDEAFYDEAALDAELRRVFDICAGCRRCFNLCDSFPRLFDLVDASPEEIHGVKSADFAQVVDACTLCDMCFMTKCPYVPPHEFNLDFPHLMLRHRAVEARKKGVNFFDKQLAETDRNGKLAGAVAPLANWATKTENKLTRPAMEAVAGIDRRAKLPVFHATTFALAAKRQPVAVNKQAPGYGRKAVLYATCFVNYNSPAIGQATREVLAHNGVETEVVYPACCGMPQMEQGQLARVAENARKVSQTMKPWLDKGYEVIALTPSCALMLKFEWPLLLPGDPDIKRLSEATSDIAEYVVDIAKKEGMAAGLKPLAGGVTVHLACHARAQNMGPKAAEMLRLIPETAVAVIERCSGHGGSWGVKKEWFEVALKVGKPVARQALKNSHAHVVSECPLAGDHIVQGMELLAKDGSEGAVPAQARHPIELVARAYGFAPDRR